METGEVREGVGEGGVIEGDCEEGGFGVVGEVDGQGRSLGIDIPCEFVEEEESGEEEEKGGEVRRELLVHGRLGKVGELPDRMMG